jgi:hypothetical protein
LINEKRGNDEAQKEKTIPVFDKAVAEPVDKTSNPLFHRVPTQSGHMWQTC